MDGKRRNPPSITELPGWQENVYSLPLTESSSNYAADRQLSRNEPLAKYPHPFPLTPPMGKKSETEANPFEDDHFCGDPTSLNHSERLASEMAYTDEAPLEFPIASAEVSIVIVNYNSGTYLSRCLTSCAAQSAEVIIVDNASTDSSLALAQSTAPDGIELKIIRNDTNVGFSRACNQGVALARGNYLLFLNPDCVIEKHAVGWLLQAVDAPDIGMVGGLLLNPDGTEQAGGRRAVPTPWRTFVRAFGLQGLAQRYPRLFDDFLLHQTPLPSEVIDVEAISGACMLVPRHAFDKIGPLDEGYFMHCEDLDWCMRFRIGGLRVSFQPRARVLHYKGRCSVNHPFAVEWHKHRGMVRFYKKFFRHQYPGVLMMTVSLGIWLRCSAVFCYLLIRRPWTQHDENQ